MISATDTHRDASANECLQALAEEGFTLLNERPYIGYGGEQVGRKWTLWHDELKLFGNFSSYWGFGPEKFNALVVSGQFTNPTGGRVSIDGVTDSGHFPSGTVYVRREDLVDIAACSWNIQNDFREFMRGLRESDYVPTGAFVDASFPTRRVDDENLPQHILDVVNAGVDVLAISELAAHGR